MQGKIPVWAGSVDDPGYEHLIGYFEPSQINALLGIARNSTGFFAESAQNVKFHDYQWWFPEDVDDTPYLEILFRDT